MLRRPSRPKKVIDKIAKAATTVAAYRHFRWENSILPSCAYHRSAGHERWVRRHQHGDQFRRWKQPRQKLITGKFHSILPASRGLRARRPCQIEIRNARP